MINMVEYDDVVTFVWYEVCHENPALFAGIGGFESYDELVSVVAVCNDCECEDVGIADILEYCRDNQRYMYKDCVKEYLDQMKDERAEESRNKNYSDMTDKELLVMLDNAHDWACDEVDPCFRILCGRHGINYDGWDFGYYGCDGLFDLLVGKVEDNK